MFCLCLLWIYWLPSLVQKTHENLENLVGCSCCVTFLCPVMEYSAVKDVLHPLLNSICGRLSKCGKVSFFGI